MTKESSEIKKPISADWFFRGVLTKVGDSIDRLTGRRWTPSSSLATSELAERLKKLLDSEAREVPGKGFVVPHNIALRMQWDKFSEDSESGIAVLRHELLTAAADHVNDSLYYTLAPIALEVKTDYFTEGVKLTASFGSFDDQARDVEMDVTAASPDTGSPSELSRAPQKVTESEIVARFKIGDRSNEAKIVIPADGRVRVGRTPENDLVISDPSVSKLHASIVAGPDNISVADTGSTNGTFMNGQRLAYGKAMILSSGDRLTFGTVEVTIELTKSALKTIEGPAGGLESADITIDGLNFRSRSAEAVPVDSDQINASLSNTMISEGRVVQA